MRPGKVNQFTMPVAKPKKLGPEHNIWYWNPRRAGIKTAPSWFMERLQELGEELHCTWNPIRERWVLWARAPRVNHPVCQGWRLLFIHEGPDKEYLPLDERVLARLWYASVLAHGSGRAYFDRIAAEMERDREKAEAAEFQDTMDRALERGWDYTRIKNIGKGSKFSEYHA